MVSKYRDILEPPPPLAQPRPPTPPAQPPRSNHAPSHGAVVDGQQGEYRTKLLQNTNTAMTASCAEGGASRPLFPQWSHHVYPQFLPGSHPNAAPLQRHAPPPPPPRNNPFYKGHYGLNNNGHHHHQQQYHHHHVHHHHDAHGPPARHHHHRAGTPPCVSCLCR